MTRKKLRSRTGASMLFAILVFMLCVLAGTAALTAAAANSGRYRHLKEEQQQYLTMSSAVELMRKELVGQEFTASLETTQIKTTYTAPAGGTAKDPEYYYSSRWVTEPDYTGGTGKLQTLLEDFFKLVLIDKDLAAKITDIDEYLPDDYTGTTPSDLSKELTITLDDDDFAEVKVELTAWADHDPNNEYNKYDIELKLTFKDAAADYPTTMSIRASTEGVKSSVSVKAVPTYSGGQLDHTTTTTTTTYTLDVKWLPENTVVEKTK